MCINTMNWTNEDNCQVNSIVRYTDLQYESLWTQQRQIHP